MKNLMFLLFLIPSVFFAQNVPSQLEKINNNIDWVMELNNYTYDFSVNYVKIYDDSPGEVSLSYGLLGSYQKTETELEAINTVFSDKAKHSSLRDVLYNWIKEPLAIAFSNLDSEMKQTYKQIIELAIDRLNSFDYNKELSYYNGLTNKHDFVFLDADGKEDPYRKINAFIFRRIHNNHLSISLLKYWANKIRHDIFS